MDDRLRSIERDASAGRVSRAELRKAQLRSGELPPRLRRVADALQAIEAWTQGADLAKSETQVLVGALRDAMCKLGYKEIANDRLYSTFEHEGLRYELRGSKVWELAHIQDKFGLRYWTSQRKVPVREFASDFQGALLKKLEG